MKNDNKHGDIFTMAEMIRKWNSVRNRDFAQKIPEVVSSTNLPAENYNRKLENINSC